MADWVSQPPGQVPHCGLGRDQDDAMVSKKFGLLGMFDTHHPLRSRLKAVAALNILFIIVTFDVSQPSIGWLKAEFSRNKPNIVVTFDVSQ
jgi:hypothetical protein